MWYFEKGGMQQGPEETESVQQRLQNGELSGNTLVWREGMADWIPLSQVAELNGSMIARSTPTGAATGGGIYAPPQHMQGPPGAGIAMPPGQNGMALTSMILGICSIVLTIGCFVGFLLAIPAVICGHIGRKQIREGASMQTGEGMALAGLIMGYVVLALVLIGMVTMIVSLTLSSGIGP